MSEITLIGHSQRVSDFDLGLYSDGTPIVKLGDFDATDIHTMVLRPRSLMTFVTAMFLVDSINQQGGWVKNLVLPYVPGARQDRINPTGDVLFTIQGVADMINARQFSRVLILDPHSPVTTKLINRATEYPLTLIAQRLWQGYGGIIAPDKGAKERAEIFAAAMGKPITYASKNRDVSTGRLSGFSVNVEAGRHYLVVDDICDGGGTFIGLGEKIREQGAFADLYVTHGIFSKGTSALSDIYRNIYTTDSRIVHERNKVARMAVVKEMENYNV